MEPMTLILIALRAAALGLGLSGSNNRRSEQLYQIADLVEAGALTDEHMKDVADLLKDRNSTDADFENVLDRIKAHRAELHRD